MADTQTTVTETAAASTEEHAFVVPRKCINSKEDMAHFKSSGAYRAVVGFIKRLNDSVIGVPTTRDIGTVSPGTTAILALLDSVSDIVDEVPPLPSNNRFGNKAYRTWHAKLVERTPELLAPVLALATPPIPQGSMRAAIDEIGPYLQDSFGNPIRIDYGTGHELHFVAFLFCLCAVGVVGEPDSCALVIRVFARYIAICQKLQAKYHQEPAGSHGVWGLDDHQFLPFVFGAAQLIDHAEIVPGSVLDRAVVERYRNESLYLECVFHIYEVKRGPFNEHSPDLWNISAAASWRKIDSGMQKKYDVDVLSKWPVVQHFLFGSLIPCSWEPSPPPARSPVFAVNSPAPHENFFAPSPVPQTAVPPPLPHVIPGTK